MKRNLLFLLLCVIVSGGISYLVTDRVIAKKNAVESFEVFKKAGLKSGFSIQHITST